MDNTTAESNITLMIHHPTNHLWAKGDQITVAKWFHRVLRWITFGYFIDKKIKTIQDASFLQLGLNPIHSMNGQAIATAVQLHRDQRDVNVRKIDEKALKLLQINISTNLINPNIQSLPKEIIKKILEELPHNELLKNFPIDDKFKWAVIEIILDRLNHGVHFREFGFSDSFIFVEFLRQIGNKALKLRILDLNNEKTLASGFHWDSRRGCHSYDNETHTLKKLLEKLNQTQASNIETLILDDCDLSDSNPEDCFYTDLEMNEDGTDRLREYPMLDKRVLKNLVTLSVRNNGYGACESSYQTPEEIGERRLKFIEQLNSTTVGQKKILPQLENLIVDGNQSYCETIK